VLSSITHNFNSYNEKFEKLLQIDFIFRIVIKTGYWRIFHLLFA
jgi:hypothetical protein